MAGLNFRKKPYGIIYEGWPKQRYIYRYYFTNESFSQYKKNRKQFVSTEPVKPIGVEEIEDNDYNHLVRKASKKEIKEKLESYSHKVRSKYFC